MPTIRFEAAVETAELLDAGEALETLVQSGGEDLDACPALLGLLLALDEAIADTVREAAGSPSS